MRKSIFADNIIKLRNEGCTYLQIRRILKCSKGTISRYASNIKIPGLKTELAFKTQEEIDELNEYLKIHTRKDAALHFKVSPNSISKYGIVRKNKWTYERSLECARNHKRKLRSEIKHKCVEYLGGVCKICGYNKCDRALDFHHINSEEKDFGISQSNTHYRFERIKSELDKCILLCKNCHAEVHAGLTKV